MRGHWFNKRKKKDYLINLQNPFHICKKTIETKESLRDGVRMCVREESGQGEGRRGAREPGKEE